ncbi:YkyA family protein [Virgibacillus salexigens]|uniref:Putative cell-wall binding lipoprotein n=1 Tax=Virgibacillus massiliensis TaxID=1462526 RepID=A0A024QCJ6_9BACI|nr:YkyA family protein [Virgibacillus massiliensis]CDQ40263.1 Putative cell-wall binding lipoprotein [Virgibacillus massiliensis]
MPMKKSVLIVISFLLFMMAACSSETTEEQIQGHLEEAVSLEKDFEEQQSKITELEKQEQELYSKIINLGMDEMDKIKELSGQAIDSIEKRSEAIKTEKASIEKAEEEFAETEDLIAEIEDEKLKETATSMTEVMQQRYETYHQLNDAYKNALALEKEMYNMLQKENLEQETLTQQINEINESYQKVIDLNNSFNEHTVDYNEQKKAFYEQAGMEVNYEKNPTGNKSKEE